MMLGTATLDALQRIADRASDVLAAYRPGAFPVHGDVARPNTPLPSNDPLSVVAPPGAWFVALDANGARTYTRAGDFHFGEDGRLAGADGAPVLGIAPDGALRPLRLDAIDQTLGRAASARIADDGTVAYTRVAIDPRSRARTNETVVIGRLALARFPAGGAPQRIDAVHARAVAGVQPHLGAPADGTFAPLRTGARDLGSVDLDTGLQKLADAYVAFSALQAAHKAQGAGDKVVMDLLK
jgi:flagellar basal body rod protein FlgG